LSIQNTLGLNYGKFQWILSEELNMRTAAKFVSWLLQQAAHHLEVCRELQ
jgi:hypothetical protein